MSIQTVEYKMDPKDPNLIELREIARGCRQGKLVVFPTETVYGVGGPMSVADISQKIAAIKERNPDKPFSYHIGDLQMLDFLEVDVTPAFRALSRNFWPGPVTLIAKNKQGDSIGLRFPRNRLITSLINTVGEPFVASSANASGQASPRNAQEAMEHLSGKVEFLIDGGDCELGEDSTVVDLTASPPKILRKGAEGEAIEAMLEKIGDGSDSGVKHILVVCTGNSCRSPMAEGWLKHELKRQRLSDKITVKSAGIMAANGRTATPEAVLIMKNREIDIADHQSQTCTREDVMNSDLIIAMSQEHYQFIVNMVPEAKEKIIVLEIPDPIGMGVMIYEEVANSIENKLRAVWEKITT